MKKNYFIGLLLLFFTLIAEVTQAQVEPCATNTIHQQNLADPDYRATFERIQADLQVHIAEKMANSASQRENATVYQIPLVVHVIHTGGAVGTIYNPTDTRINEMLTKINSDFRNGGGAGSDVEIEFIYAKRDPSCNASTGINRVNGSGLTNYTAGGIGTGGATDATVKALSIWPNTDYYNIWIVNKIDGNDGTSGSFTAGYAFFPGASPAVDGTVILATQVNGTSATMTHELGHAFALQHTFHKAETGNDSANATDCPANTDCATQGDLICDTDPHAYMLGTCATTNCGGVSAATLANYMSYCNAQDRFSPNQVTRMRTALETQRGGLISSLGATALSGTLPPLACTPTATGTFSGFGITRFNMNTLNLTSGRSDSEGNYVNRVCTQGTTVNAGTTHPLKIETSVNSHNVKVYIDYNKDGDFLDAGEEVATGTSTNVAGTFTYTTNYTAPAAGTAGVIFNEALRLRVVSSFVGDGTATSCAVFRGQAEDYSITIQSAAVPTITLGTLGTSFCSGSTISVPFTTTGTFVGGNTFTAELSDATGNFGTITATQTGTSPISLTAPTTAGTGYKVRVRASNPATTSNLSADITVNALPNNITIVANPTSVTSGNGSTIEVPTSQIGVNYQLQNTAGNVNVGAVVAGTGGTISLPTGNLTVSTSFRVVATHATTTCTRTLNTVTVTVTGAAPTITLGTLGTSFCSGSTISVPFTTTGTFVGGNTFTAELSDAAGNFGTITATQTGTSPISLTAPTTAGTGYKVRVRASNPATTSNLSADITVNALPNNITIVANPTSVTSGNGSTIEVPTSQIGVNYQLQNTAGNVNVGAVVAGTGGTISLPTGNLTVSTSFRVVATHATTTCTRTLNTVTVTVTGAAPTITLGTLGTSFCSGSTISVPFTTTGTFVGGNTFTAELSDAAGNFGTITATQTGTSPISLTAPTTAGTGYKVRVRASNPATTSNLSADITVNALPNNITIVANPTSVTSGNGSTIEVPTSQIGVNYQLQNTAGNVNVGAVVAGTGGTISLPTGNLTVSTSFRVVATHATTTCTRTLNTVTVTVTGTTGGGGGGTTTTVASPTNFRAVGTSTSQIDLTWTAVNGATSYIITSGNTQVATLPTGTTSFEHTGLTADTSYPYSLVAINGSVRSNAVQATGRTLPNAPTVVSVMESCGEGSVSIVLTGTGSTYRIYDAATAGTLVAEINTATYTTPILTQSTTYFISTVSNGNESTRTQVEAVVATPIIATITEGSSLRSCGATTTLTANVVDGATYTWLVNGIVISGATANTLEVTRTSSYQVRITRGSCTVTSSFTRVTLNYAPTANISQGIATNFCESGTISASEATNATYEWTLNGAVVGSDRQLSVSSSGLYTLTVTEDGCSATDDIQVTITSLPSVSVSASSSTFCAGERVTLSTDNVNSVRYDWSRNGRVIRRNAGNTIEVTSGGEYSVTISQNNCTSSSTSISVERINEEITYLRSTENTLFVEPKNTSTQITNVTWFLEGEESTTFSGETITPTESGNYYAVVTYSTGCTYKTRSAYFRLFVPVIVTGEDEKLANALRIYPNPSTGTFKIELGEIQEQITITVTDALGRFIKTEKIPLGASLYSLSLTEYSSGIYTIKIQTEKGMVIKKLIIE
ncbi:M43 family zinc metalloprotease [Bernardetia sp. OM2101]|uniref:M43 family zinc metalloprotease n=1 Tax=Bernardetia sp. OM2101 TaxID=3344876 RepID=UPI0035CEF119